MADYKTMDANEAVSNVAYKFSELCGIYPITPASPMAEKVDVLANSNNDPRYPIITESTTTLAWCSQNIENSWYEVFFNNNSFYLESYSIRTYYHDFFSEWEVYGSNDGYQGFKVDELDTEFTSLFDFAT